MSPAVAEPLARSLEHAVDVMRFTVRAASDGYEVNLSPWAAELELAALIVEAAHSVQDWTAT